MDVMYIMFAIRHLKYIGQGYTIVATPTPVKILPMYYGI
jgi:hypothetical protein